MSIKSTYAICRTVAQQALFQHIFTLTNRELEDALEMLPKSKFRNYRVFDLVGDINKDDWGDGDYVIDDINEF